MTAQEILKIVEENYSVEDFAYGEWLEAKSAGNVQFSEEVTEAQRKYDEAYEKMKAHPAYNNYKLVDDDYESLKQDFYKVTTPHEQQTKELLNHLGLGEVEEVAQYGGEGQGETWYSVKYFKDHDVYIKTNGYYQSYNGTEFDDGYGEEVRPQQKTITVYE